MVRGVGGVPCACGFGGDGGHGHRHAATGRDGTSEPSCDRTRLCIRLMQARNCPRTATAQPTRPPAGSIAHSPGLLCPSPHLRGGVQVAGGGPAPGCFWSLAGDKLLALPYRRSATCLSRDSRPRHSEQRVLLYSCTALTQIDLMLTLQLRCIGGQLYSYNQVSTHKHASAASRWSLLPR